MTPFSGHFYNSLIIYSNLVDYTACDILSWSIHHHFIAPNYSSFIISCRSLTISLLVLPFYSIKLLPKGFHFIFSTHTHQISYMFHCLFIFFDILRFPNSSKVFCSHFHISQPCRPPNCSFILHFTTMCSPLSMGRWWSTAVIIVMLWWL